MSCRILVIPEDPTYDRAILQPLMEHIARQCGKPNAKVTVLTNPYIRGIDDLRRKISTIAARYAHMDAIICVVDADGKDRDGMFTAMKESTKLLGVDLICCAAQQEVEVWLLAGHDTKLPHSWSQVRSNPSVKEEIFIPFLTQYGNPKSPAGGRDQLM